MTTLPDAAPPLRREAIYLAMLIASAAAFTLGGYEFIRTPTNTLYKLEYGKANLPMVMAFLPLSVMAILYVYARILSWLGARKTLLVTSLGAAAVIALGQVAYDAGIKPAIVVLYLFSSAYVVLLIEQYWSYLNSVLKDSEAMRLNGPICGVASLGAIAADAVGHGVTSTLGTSTMMLLAAACTLPAAFVSDWAYRRSGEPRDQTIGHARRGGHLALGEFKSRPVLVLLLAIVLATQVIAAVLALAFQGELQDFLPDPDQQSTYSFKIYGLINLIAAGLQFVVAPLLLRWVRPGIIHVAMPLLQLFMVAAYLNDPGLTSIAAAYVAFKCIDYSVFRAAKEILYIPLPFDARYRAKEVIDVFGYRFSKGVTAGVITIVQNAGILFSEVMYAAVAGGAYLIWAGLAAPLGKLYKSAKTAPTKEAA
jgi:AAA family ATP:ADP antiporter